MSVCRFQQQRIVFKRTSKAEIAPGAAQLQSVQVRELSVVSVADGGWLEERARNFGQERGEPARKNRHQPTHQVRLDEAGREKVVAARLPLRRVVAVVPIEGHAFLDDDIPEIA